MLLFSLLFIPSLSDAKIKCPSGSFASGTICLDNTKRTQVTPISNSDEIQVTDEQIGYIIIGAIIFIIIIAIVIKATTGGSDGHSSSQYDYAGSQRRGWTELEKEQVRIIQDGKCNKCGRPPPRWEYHHRDGNRSNNSLRNCEGLCPNCHSVKTHDE